MATRKCDKCGDPFPSGYSGTTCPHCVNLIASRERVREAYDEISKAKQLLVETVDRLNECEPEELDTLCAIDRILTAIAKET